MKRINRFYESALLKRFYNYLKLPLLFQKHDKLCKSLGVHSASIEGLRQSKQSSRLFVLGSGSSINNISNAQWEHISQHDSIGVNRWFYHSFCPTFLVIDPPKEAEMIDIMSYGLSKKKEAYARTQIIMTSPPGDSRTKFIKKAVENEINFQLAFTSHIYAKEIHELAAACQEMKLFRLLEVSSLFWTKTASLDWILLTAIRMGYSEVIFCGVDLKDTKYYYEENPIWVLESGIPLPPKLQKGSVHKTLDPKNCYGGIPINQILYKYLEVFGERVNLQCYVAHSLSGLHTVLPVYPW